MSRFLHPRSIILASNPTRPGNRTGPGSSTCLSRLLLCLFLLLSAVCLSGSLAAQQSGGQDVFQKANNAVNKATNAIAVFQPYLLKARQLFYDAKQMAGDVKNYAKSTFGKNGNITNTGVAGPNYSNGNTIQSGSYDTSHNYNQYNQNPQYTGSQGSQYNQGGNTQNNSSSTYSSGSASQGGYPTNATQGGTQSNATGQNIQSYLPNQSMPINNAASVNNDGTGNWGNQNNGLYGNCLDALTGTVMGIGEAAQKPAAVDLLFFAPADGQNTYILMTPGFARNNSTATYMTEHVSDQVQQWSDVTESEVALTKLTLGQFTQIQNNGQIQNAVRNAQNYSGLYTSVGQKLDGQVFAVKVQMENREVYALIAVLKQIGTSGSNGYLKIRIKALGIDNNNNGSPDANNYIR